LNVGNERVEFNDLGVLYNHSLLRKVIGEQLKIYVPRVKASDWEEIVAQLFESIKIDEVPADVSKVGEFLDYLKEFCLGRGEAFKMDELEMQKAFTDYDSKKTFTRKKKEFEAVPTYLRLVDLSKWLENNKNFKVQRVWIVQRLKEIGGMSVLVSVRKVQTRAWVIPAFEKSEEEISTPSVLKSNDEPSKEKTVLGGDDEEEIPF
jgi:diphthamide synthase subunit DPH2